MTISQIKNDLNKHIGETATIKCNLGRNEYEKYHVTIKELYNNIEQPIKLSSLIKYPILLQKDPSNSYASAKKLFKENNLKVDSKLNIGSSSLLIDFTKIGYGIGYVTKLYIEKEKLSLTLFKSNTIFIFFFRNLNIT